MKRTSTTFYSDKPEPESENPQKPNVAAPKYYKKICNESVGSKNSKNIGYRNISVVKEGIDLRKAMVIWEEMAKCESRLELMGKMKESKVGFNEVENFAEKIDRNRLEKESNKGVGVKKEKIIKLTMDIKLTDERRRHSRLVKEKKLAKEEIIKKCKGDKNTIKSIMKRLRKVATKVKSKQRKKNSKKVEHLVEKKESRNRGVGGGGGKDRKDVWMEYLPKEMGEVTEIVAFNREKFEDIGVIESKECIIGEVKLNENEKETLKLHPKFAVRQKVTEEQFELDMECGFAKLRWEIGGDESREERREVKEGGRCGAADSKKESTEAEIQEEEIARSEMIFDPEEKTYDARKMKVTNLPENTRITLPKPLRAIEEAEIEVRRNEYMKVVREYIKKETIGGKQESNLTEQEQKGLKSLRQRIEKEEIMVIKTDKSSKLAVIETSKYLEMGRENRGKDKKISREEMKSREKTLNEHTEMWVRMTRAGENHGHESRVRKSRTSNSNNTASLYYMYKDHKREIKFRDVASGSTSNTLGLSNVISELIEAVAGSARENYEVISSEDMIANIEKVNNKKREEGSNSTEESSCNEMEEEEKSGEESRGAKSIGEEVKRLHIIGFDAVALYPSMKARETAKVCREEVIEILNEGEMKVEGLDMNKVTLYIRMNKHLTGDLKELWRYIPFRKKVGGVEPGMSSKGVKEDTENEQWCWPKAEITEKVRIELIGRMVEIGVRVMFGNLVYSFGGENYLQTEGGPIGIRGTGAVAKLRTRSFCKKLKRVIEEGKMTVEMLKIYVDDGRLIMREPEKGAVYNKESKKVEFTEKQLEEDERDKEEGKTVDYRIKKLLLPIMNDISEDLKWTIEIEEDFIQNEEEVEEVEDCSRDTKKGEIKSKSRSNGKRGGIPTLDFKVYWSEEEKKFMYTYYEKEMRNPVVVHRRSAMDKKQKYGILSEELVRRLSNISTGGEEKRETERVINDYTKQLKCSGYRFEEAREVVKSGWIGLIRKKERRKKNNLPMHREGWKTLSGRVRKKLVSRKMWYKKESQKDDEELIGRPRMSKKRKVEKESEEKSKKEVAVKSVIFVQQTKDSTLVKRLREVEEGLASTTGYRVKFVEKVGEKMVDTLCQSNPWRGADCQRKECILCETKLKTGKRLKQNCSARNVTYETWCGTCEDRDKEKLEEEKTLEAPEGERKGRTEVMKVRLHKYVGETGRSSFERGVEHTRDRKKWKLGSHMLKHIAEHHEEEDEAKVDFRMRIIRTHRSAFERQIYEGVRIQRERRENNILNSKSEYSRCALPRLEVKLGESSRGYKDSKEKEEEKREAELEQKIVEMRKKAKLGKKRKKSKNEEDQIVDGEETEEVPKAEKKNYNSNKRRKLGTGSKGGGRKWWEKINETSGGEEVGTKKVGGEMKEEEEQPVENLKSKECDVVKSRSKDKKVKNIEYIEYKEPKKEKTEKQMLLLRNVNVYTVSEEKTAVDMTREEKIVNTKEGKLEDGKSLEGRWEMMRRIRDILEENDEKWSRLEEERLALKEKSEQKERRFEKIREKKRKIEETLRGDKEEEEKQLKGIELYEARWNIWNRRRDVKNSHEKVVGEVEKRRKIASWMEKKESKGMEIEQEFNIGEKNDWEKDLEAEWGKFEEVVREIEVTERFWDEENEPVEGEEITYKERKKPRLEQEERKKSVVVQKKCLENIGKGGNQVMGVVGGEIGKIREGEKKQKVEYKEIIKKPERGQARVQSGGGGTRSRDIRDFFKIVAPKKGIENIANEEEKPVGEDQSEYMARNSKEQMMGGEWGTEYMKGEKTMIEYMNLRQKGEEMPKYGEGGEKTHQSEYNGLRRNYNDSEWGYREPEKYENGENYLEIVQDTSKGALSTTKGEMREFKQYTREQHHEIYAQPRHIGYRGQHKPSYDGGVKDGGLGQGTSGYIGQYKPSSGGGVRDGGCAQDTREQQYEIRAQPEYIECGGLYNPSYDGGVKDGGLGQGTSGYIGQFKPSRSGGMRDGGCAEGTREQQYKIRAQPEYNECGGQYNPTYDGGVKDGGRDQGTNWYIGQYKPSRDGGVRDGGCVQDTRVQQYNMRAQPEYNECGELYNPSYDSGVKCGRYVQNNIYTNAENNIIHGGASGSRCTDNSEPVLESVQSALN